MDLRAVIFDMDGTVVDTPYDWVQIKQELQTDGRPILHYLSTLSEPERSRKWAILEEIEKKATSRAKLMPGIPEFLEFLRGQEIRTALVTNNSILNVNILLEKFRLRFETVLAREDGLWKPSGDSFLEVMRRFGINREECCAVGDSQFDLLAAQDAGLACFFLVCPEPDSFRDSGAVVCRSIPEVHCHLKKKLETAAPE